MHISSLSISLQSIGNHIINFLPKQYPLLQLHHIKTMTTGNLFGQQLCLFLFFCQDNQNDHHLDIMDLCSEKNVPHKVEKTNRPFPRSSNG